MRRTTAMVVEDVLRDFPRICHARAEREAWLEAMAHTRGEVPCEGGEKLSSPEALTDLKNQNRELKELTAVINDIWKALRGLPDEQKALVQHVYFQEEELKNAGMKLGMTERTAWRVRERMLRTMRDTCLKDLLWVERWRDREEAAKRKMMRLAEAGQR